MNIGGGINPGGIIGELLGSKGKGGNKRGEEVSWSTGEVGSNPFVSSVPEKGNY